MVYGGFQESGPFFGSPCGQDYSIEVDFGAPYFGKSHILFGRVYMVYSIQCIVHSIWPAIYEDPTIPSFMESP